jgi:hypothetical protein
MNTLLYIIGSFILLLIEINFNQDYKLINTIYKNPIFKLVFLFGIYLYGNNDVVFTLLCAIYYVYLGQNIQQKELLSR